MEKYLLFPMANSVFLLLVTLYYTTVCYTTVINVSHYLVSCANCSCIVIVSLNYPCSNWTAEVTLQPYVFMLFSPSSPCHAFSSNHDSPGQELSFCQGIHRLMRMVVHTAPFLCFICKCGWHTNTKAGLAPLCYMHMSHILQVKLSAKWTGTTCYVECAVWMENWCISTV